MMNVRKSCHHGKSGYENQLLPVLSLLNDFDMIEVDFVCYQNQYISSHDYDLSNIEKGSTLEEWVELVMNHDKILWIDLKDETSSVFIPQMSELNMDRLFDLLDTLHETWDKLHKHIIIGCQYHQVYEYLTSFTHPFTILRDLPKDQMYVMDMIAPDYFKEMTHQMIIDQTKLEVGKAKMVAIDIQFFNETQLLDFIDICYASTIILYNCPPNYMLQHHKHLIHQYDY